MQLYLNNLIKRVKEYSLNLDKLEYLVDIPWVLIDDEYKVQKYIFKRNGELVLSINGKADVGRWEYISSAKSLLIDRNTDKILLNQVFFNEAVMILNYDGLDQSFNLVNQILIPDLNVESYFKKLYYDKNSIKAIELENGQILEVLNFNELYSKSILNLPIKIEGNSSIEFDVFKSKDGKKYIINNNKIAKIIQPIKYDTENGQIYIEHEIGESPKLDNLVFRINSNVEDGKYNIGFLKNIYVKDGKIIKISRF